MKKFTILLVLISLSAFVYAQQDTHPLQALPLSSLLDRNPSSTTPAPPIKGNNTVKKNLYRSAGIIVFDTLGSAGNAYTTDDSQCHDVIADSATNTVIFIHRYNPPVSQPNYNAWYMYDISQNGGNSWTNNVGPLNPNCKDSVGWYNSRYPMVAIQDNNSGSVTSDSSYLVYLGSWHNDENVANPWKGIITGVGQLSGNVGTRTERDSTTDNGNVTVASSLVKGLPNVFWAVDQEYSGYSNDSIVIVYRGVWNDTIKDVNWTTYKRINPHFFNYMDTTSSLTPMIAFDPTGMIGWIGSCADFGGALQGSYTPYLFNTTDGGVTWTGPYKCPMNTIPCITNNIAQLPPNGESGTGLPIAGFDLSLAVDKTGAPHLFTVVGSLAGNYAHDIESGLNMDVFDFSYSVANSTWSATLVDTIYTFRGAIGAGSEGAYTQDNRPQVSTSPDGSKVLFLWNDSPSNATAQGDNNTYPDVIGAAYDVDTKLWTEPIDFTANDPNWGGASPFLSVSPISLDSAGSITVPVVITQLNPSNPDPDDSVKFFYFKNITFPAGTYTVDKSNCPQTDGINNVTKSDNVNLYPNPADDEIIISTSPALGNSIVNVYNMMGQLVLTDKINYNNAYTLNTQSFTGGVYTISLVNGNSVTTRQFVVSH